MRRIRPKAKTPKADARAAKEDVNRARHGMDASKRKRDGEGRASRVYVVQAGDTLRSIALKLYGDEDRWTELYRANDDRMSRAGELMPGQSLLVP